MVVAIHTAFCIIGIGIWHLANSGSIPRLPFGVSIWIWSQDVDLETLVRIRIRIRVCIHIHTCIHNTNYSNNRLVEQTTHQAHDDVKVLFLEPRHNHTAWSCRSFGKPSRGFLSSSATATVQGKHCDDMNTVTDRNWEGMSTGERECRILASVQCESKCKYQCQC